MAFEGPGSPTALSLCHSWRSCAQLSLQAGLDSHQGLQKGGFFFLGPPFVVDVFIKPPELPPALEGSVTTGVGNSLPHIPGASQAASSPLC